MTILGGEPCGPQSLPTCLQPWSFSCPTERPRRFGPTWCIRPYGLPLWSWPPFAPWGLRVSVAAVVSYGVSVQRQRSNPYSLGMGLARYPYLITSDVTIADAAPRETLQLVLAVLLLGALGLFPSLYYLYRLFKGDSIFREFE